MMATVDLQTAKAYGRKGFTSLARVGYGARGVVYLIIGWLSLLSALGNRGETPDAQGAIERLSHAPGGWVLVLILALGLLGHSVWRFCQAVLDADLLGHDARALVIRAASLASSMTHLALALWAGKRALGWATAGEFSQRSMIQLLMSQPLGQWLVAVVGAGLVVVGIAQFAKGHRETFERRFDWKYDERRKLILFCKFGLYARGVIFGIIGGLTIYAAWKTDSSEAGGLREALQWLKEQPFGPWLLAAVGIGLMCFGVYSFVAAVHRRVRPPV
jgi:hypothetical protein